MLTFNHRIAQEFEKLIQLKLYHVTQSLLFGPSLDINQLRHLQGQAAAFTEALELLSDAIATCEAK